MENRDGIGVNFLAIFRCRIIVKTKSLYGRGEVSERKGVSLVMLEEVKANST